MDLDLDIDKLKEKFLSGELEKGMYSGKDSDGNDIILMVEPDVGFDIRTNQPNGWVRVNSFDYSKEDNEWTPSESFSGKWKN